MKEELKKQKGINIWTEDQLYELFKQKKIEEQIDIEVLDKFLHDLGIIIHFREPSLKEYVILNPNWLTKSFYSLISDLAIQKNKGIFTHRDLERIWNGKEYYQHGKDLTQFLLMLMSRNKYELIINRGNETYLIPELLDLSPPSLKRDWADINDHVFEYRYNILLPGIMSRFIVKTYEYILEQEGKKQCWRNGAILENENYNAQFSSPKPKAFVEADNENNKILIKLKNDSQNELLSLIQDKFKEIHESYPNLTVTPHLPCPCSEDCNDTFTHNELENSERKGFNNVRCSKANMTNIEPLRNKYRYTRQYHQRAYEVEICPPPESIVNKPLMKQFTDLLKADIVELWDSHKKFAVIMFLIITSVTGSIFWLFYPENPMFQDVWDLAIKLVKKI